MSNEPEEGGLSRERSLAISLLAMTAIAFYVCYLLALPFLPALAWGLALAVIGHPMHVWIERRAPWRGLAAAAAVAIVSLVIILPTAFVVHHLALNIAEHASDARQYVLDVVENTERFGPLREMIESQGFKEQITTATQRIAQLAPRYLAGSVWVGAQLLITLFFLFYFFRDRRDALRLVRSLLPLSREETDHAFQRVEDTIFATLYGSVTVAVLQGTMAGAMFFLLGIPGALLWGVVMGFLALIPMLGTFVIWMPTAIFLAATGQWWKAMVLFAWGSIAIALIDNLLYPVLVGKRLRFHPVLVFVSIVGGITLFGAAGIVLGPLVLSITDALLDAWRARTADGGTIEGGIEA